MNERADNEADIAEFIPAELAKKLWERLESDNYIWSQFSVEKDSETGKYSIIDPNGETSYTRMGDELVFDTKKDAQDSLSHMREAQNEEDPQVKLSGLELEVGGEWAVNLYDKKLKNRANHMFGKKKWGKPKVFNDKIPTANYEDVEFDVKVNGNDPSVAGDENLMNHEIGRADELLLDLLNNYKDEDIETIRDEWVQGPDDDGRSPRRYVTEREIGRRDLAIKNWLDKAVSASHRDQLKLEWLPQTQNVWLLPITQQMKDKIPGEDTPTFDIQELPAQGKGDRSAINMINNVMTGADGLIIEDDDYGTMAIAEGMGYIKDGDTYKFDERIPKHVDIIAGMYQASWYVDLETKRSTEKLYNKIPKQIDRPEGQAVGEAEQKADQVKLAKYLNQSWGTYREAADSTDKGEFLPVKNVLLRPKGVESGKGRQLLIQISSDFKSEGSSNIGDSYYEALYSKREGYLRPSNDFWELPEWMNRMAYFLPDSDIYVVRNLQCA